MSLKQALKSALKLCEWIAETPHHFGSINGLAAQVEHAARAAINEDAMQRLTDIQQEIENDSPDMPPFNSIHSRVSDGSNRGVEPVTDCHDKVVNHISDATKIIEPVAYVNEEGWFRSAEDADAAFRATARPLYAAPPKREPLTDAEINGLELPASGTATIRDMVRLIERAHGIGGEE